ncbi:MAG: amidohydrolase family protein [Methanomicrobiales archaeon]|nr:amidohydrolase family protein [Methanomicrobiales archaeon]
MLDLLLKDARLPDGRIVDISISGGVVVHCGAPSGRADSIVECRRRLCLPGAIDMHVHMRGGVQAHKEDWESGTKSALAGGVTLVVDQPNTLPPVTSEARFVERVSEASEKAFTHYAINAGAAEDADLEALWRAGAMAFGEIFTATSSYSEPLKPQMLERLLHTIDRLDAVATIHAERPLSDGAESLSGHEIQRPIRGEVEAVRTVSSLSSIRRVHFCHLSSPDSIDVARGSVEVSPHHLFLCLERFDDDDPRGKVNPPLRRREVQEMLWSRWRRIDVIASDHAPHLLSEKSVPFADAPAGMPGVETMLPLLVARALKGAITLDSVVEKTVRRPAEILGISPPGFRPGCRADLALYAEGAHEIGSEILHSRAGWTPFEGMEGVFPDIVLLNGERVYDGGEFLRGEPRWFPGRGYIERRE